MTAADAPSNMGRRPHPERHAMPNGPSTLPDTHGADPRHDWTLERGRGAVRAAVHRPDLPRAAGAPRLASSRTRVQMSTLLSIKTGACPEDCAYCPQSVRYETGVEREDADAVGAGAGAGARRARRRRDALLHGRGLPLAQGARTCEQIAQMVREVRALGLETCATLGMLTPRAGAAAQGRRPRLLQPQPRHLRGVLRRDHHHAHATRTGSTRSRRCATPGLNVCCGGIVGMGETRARSRAAAA